MTNMVTQNTKPDTDFPPTDPVFDALLDEALSTGTPAADPQLTERICQQTLPMLGKRPVLARIGPTLLRVAAAVAVIAGGVFAVSLLNQESTDTPEVIVQTDPPAVPDERYDARLVQLADALEPGNTLIDEQLDVLALRVDLASAESDWGADGLSTDDLIDRAVVRFEIDQFSEDTALFLSDEPTLF